MCYAKNMERIFQLTQDITAYMQRLALRENIQVCVCDLHAFPSFVIERLTPFHGHINAFCQTAKNSYGQRRCLLMQKFARKKAVDGKPFVGKCHAGAVEGVFPIVEGDEYIGFLCTPCTDEVALQEIAPLLAPLSHSFRLLYLQLKRLDICHTVAKKDTFEELLQFLTMHYAQIKTAEDIATALHYSPSYLSHLFLKKKGVSIMRYVRTLKLRHAKKLLLSSTQTVAEISSLPAEHAERLKTSAISVISMRAEEIIFLATLFFIFVI